MNEGLIPRRYAKALFKVALDRHCDQRVYELMLTLAHSFDTMHELHTLVANPFVEQSKKDDIISTAAGASDADKTFADFLKLLAQNKRIDMINAIANAYVDVYRQAHNIRRVEVISAQQLDPATVGRIKSLVEQNLNGATMEFSSSTNPDIIGGFIVNIDNERLDASLSHKLEEMRRQLLK